jgi:signal transduction histidine kinase/CheY-like chemotaxis protein
VDDARERLEYQLQMEALVLEVAGRFLSVRCGDDLDSAIHATLAEVGQLASSDMAYLFQVEPDGQTASMTHQWTAPGVSVPDQMVRTNLDQIPRWVDTLRSGQPHVVPDTSVFEASPALRASLQEFSVRSVLAVPMKVAEGLTGWLGLAAIDRPCDWTEGHVKLMQFVGHSVGQTLRRLRDEKELERSRARFVAFLEQNPDGMYVLELEPPMPTSLPEDEQMERVLDGKIVLCNEKAAARFGADHPRDILGHSFRTLFGRRFTDAGLENLRQDTLSFIRNGYRIRVDEAANPMPDGTIQWVSRAAHGVIDDGHLTTIWATARDITRDKEARDQREQLARRLEQSERLESIGLLAGGVAHDFNNLLLAILGNADLAAVDPSNAARVQDCLGEIRRAGQRAAELTRQLLAFSRRQPTAKKPLELNRLLHSTTRMLERLLPESIALDFIPGHDLGVILGDEAQMEQIVLNLCLNARDAMPTGGRLTIETQNVRINGEYSRTHPWARPGRYVLLVVTDTGAGISHEDLEHIFEPFYTTKSLGYGTGLGLATVYGIVQQHEGMVQVYSELGMGTTFKVYLPITEQGAASVGSEVRPAPRGGTETILLAEDEEQVRTVAARILERAGYTVETVSDGARAVEAFEADPHRFDLVLLDVVMPTMNGREARRRMQSVRSDVPVLFSSGYTGTVLDGVDLQELGSPVLHKPYDPDHLLLAVRQALDGGERTAGPS